MMFFNIEDKLSKTGSSIIGRLFILATFLLPYELGIASDQEDADQFVISWLTLLDQREFELAWDGLAVTARKPISKQYWLWGLGYLRDEIGDIESRFLREKRMELDGLGNIGLAVFTFKSKFESMEHATEIVRVGKEKGSWKVITYELKDPTKTPPPIPYPSRSECEKSFSPEAGEVIAPQYSEAVQFLTEFLDAVATGDFSEVERSRLITSRNPQCFMPSKVIDVGNKFPDHFCFRKDELVIEVLEKRPDNVSYYSLRHIDGEWSIAGWHAESSFESCLSL